MCNISRITSLKQGMLFSGFLLALISILLFHLFLSQLTLTLVYLFFIMFFLGLLLFIISSFLFLFAIAAGENSWKNLSHYVLILSLLLWAVISTIKIKPNDIVNIQNTYITIDIAIISVSFAAIAINSEHLIGLLKKVKKVNEPNDCPFFDIGRFQNFIIVTAFMILFSVFVSVLTSIIPDTPPLFNFFYISSFLFGMTTCMTFILIFLLMGYLSAIIDRILYPEKYDSPKAPKVS